MDDWLFLPRHESITGLISTMSGKYGKKTNDAWGLYARQSRLQTTLVLQNFELCNDDAAAHPKERKGASTAVAHEIWAVPEKDGDTVTPLPDVRDERMAHCSG